MFSLSRRAFLASSLAGLASGRILGMDKTDEPTVKASDDPAFQPSTLFLTWQRDPTTTMTVQWVGVTGETADTKVSYAASQTGPFQTQAPVIKPYPLTDFKVFRAELTGLKPGTDYWFKIGKSAQ